jgi:hypothetical protein
VPLAPQLPQLPNRHLPLPSLHLLARPAMPQLVLTNSLLAILLLELLLWVTTLPSRFVLGSASHIYISLIAIHSAAKCLFFSFSSECRKWRVFRFSYPQCPDDIDSISFKLGLICMAASTKVRVRGSN